jgi:hypothetical protein
MNRKWLVCFLPLIFVLTGCDDRFRYPCQDPDNWDKQECKKPWCSADGTCPEDLTHYEKKNGVPTVPTAVKIPTNDKGACK